MNKILLSASAVFALCATQVSAETTFGGYVGLVNKVTDTSNETWADFITYVDGDYGRFQAARDGKENSINYSDSFGDTSVSATYNITTETATLFASHSLGKISFGGEVNTNDEWNVYTRYDSDPIYALIKINQADTVTVAGGYNYNGFSIGGEANTADEWSVAMGYAVDGYYVSTGFQHDNDYSFEGGYKINDNFTLRAGYYVEDAQESEKTKIGLAFTF